MLRWIHEKVTRHDWQEVAHRHDMQEGEQSIDCYKLVDCKCGAVREEYMVKHALPSPFPGIEVGFAEVHVHDLARLEDAKVWAK